MKKLLPLILLAACGSDKDGGGSSTKPAPLLSLTQSELPECNEDRDNHVVYVKDANQFQVCSGGSWAALTQTEEEEFTFDEADKRLMMLAPCDELKNLPEDIRKVLYSNHFVYVATTSNFYGEGETAGEKLSWSVKVKEGKIMEIRREEGKREDRWSCP